MFTQNAFQNKSADVISHFPNSPEITSPGQMPDQQFLGDPDGRSDFEAADDFTPQIQPFYQTVPVIYFVCNQRPS